ncbi:SsrA-binding protein [Candidatus Ornithobacterium hominis]|uniref:SsrA-binding protein n=1 Tax=Candidatus Ornithobacterium hominis TaxID=2497989 RepID=A0A383TU51_9FLAO|nr:SsrA-binding protein SmpB [Candidatus Ornithobacterium hominis]SZD71085.1 SsrA-binding protein [Candidatus Ornithobacterium hominis]SZD71758.1 SsrA-binding protein [Candidatus Ornithobacterium hominis]
MIQKDVNIKNKKAKFNYELLDDYIAGIQLKGTEIKSIRMGKASIAESFCEVKNGEIFIVNMHINEYDFGTHNNHKIKRDRKLLLNRREIDKLERKTKETGLTIVPLNLFINQKGLAKVKISLAKGKKLFDKRESIKKKDMQRDIARIKKNF